MDLALFRPRVARLKRSNFSPDRRLDEFPSRVPASVSRTRDLLLSDRWMDDIRQMDRADCEPNAGADGPVPGRTPKAAPAFNVFSGVRRENLSVANCACRMGMD